MDIQPIARSDAGADRRAFDALREAVSEVIGALYAAGNAVAPGEEARFVRHMRAANDALARARME